MSVTTRQLTRALQKHGKLFFAEVDTTSTSSSRHERERQGLIYEDSTRDKEMLKRDLSMICEQILNEEYITAATSKQIETCQSRLEHF